MATNRGKSRQKPTVCGVNFIAMGIAEFTAYANDLAKCISDANLHVVVIVALKERQWRLGKKPVWHTFC
ncbi:MAG: hypothetical protein AAFR21_05130 [Pseudomonadota bacterium]